MTGRVYDRSSAACVRGMASAGVTPRVVVDARGESVEARVQARLQRIDPGAESIDPASEVGTLGVNPGGEVGDPPSEIGSLGIDPCVEPSGKPVDPSPQGGPQVEEGSEGAQNADAPSRAIAVQAAASIPAT